MQYFTFIQVFSPPSRSKMDKFYTQSTALRSEIANIVNFKYESNSQPVILNIRI